MVLTMPTVKSHLSIKGIGITEFMLMLPILLLIGMSILHFVLIAQAKSTLEYATLMAARVGATTGLDTDRMYQELSFRLQPAAVGNQLIESDQIDIVILNPTVAMFNSCGMPLTADLYSNQVACLYSNRCQIPLANNRMPYEASVCAGHSRAYASMLTIEVIYAFDSKVPFLSHWYATYFPLRSRVTVKLQKPPLLTIGNRQLFGAF